MNNIGNNLKRFRLLNNMSLKEAGKLLNMSAPAVAKYESGKLFPNSQKLIAFARIYNVKTVDILNSYEAPKLKFTNFQKKKSLTGQKLDLLKEIIANEIAKYLEVITLNSTNLKNVKIRQYICHTYQDAEYAATDFRYAFNLPNNQPISDLINTLENLGIVIIQIKNPHNYFKDFAGFSEIVNKIPFIVIPGDIKDGSSQRFTIAHELGHLVLNIENNTLNTEKMCDKFASSLLMPKEAVYNEFGNTRKNISLYELTIFKREYKVNKLDIVHRLKDLSVISEYTFKNLSKQVSNNLNLLEPEETYQFKKLVHKLEIDSIISLNKACELLGVTANEYQNEDNNY